MLVKLVRTDIHLFHMAPSQPPESRSTPVLLKRKGRPFRSCTAQGSASKPRIAHLVARPKSRRASGGPNSTTGITGTWGAAYSPLINLIAKKISHPITHAEEASIQRRSIPRRQFRGRLSCSMLNRRCCMMFPRWIQNFGHAGIRTLQRRRRRLSIRPVPDPIMSIRGWKGKLFRQRQP